MFCRNSVQHTPAASRAASRAIGSLLLLALAVAGRAAVSKTVYTDAGRLADRGHALFVECEYKRAGRAFEKALFRDRENTELMFWAGKSYARLAEISSPLSAPAHARAARVYLEMAVASEPRNPEYLQELFAFYLESPQWFSGGLERAEQLTERMGPGESERSRAIEDSRREYSGPAWWARRTVLTSSRAASHIAKPPVNCRLSAYAEASSYVGTAKDLK